MRDEDKQEAFGCRAPTDQELRERHTGMVFGFILGAALTATILPWILAALR